MRPAENAFQVRDREIAVLIRVETPAPVDGVAVSDGVVAGEDRAPAIEVMPARRAALAGKTEQFPVELGRALDVPDGQDHPVEPKSHFVSWNRRIPPQSSSPLPVSLYRLE